MSNPLQENLPGRIQEDLEQLDVIQHHPDRSRVERTLVALFLVLIILLYATPHVALAELTELDEEDAWWEVSGSDDWFNNPVILDNPAILIEQLTTAGLSEHDIQAVLDDVYAFSIVQSSGLFSDSGVEKPSDKVTVSRSVTNTIATWETQDNGARQEQLRLGLVLHGAVDSAQGLNLRMEPWTNGNRLTILQNRTPFEAVGRDVTGEWLLVLVDGAGSSDLGWVHKDYTTLRDNSQVERLQSFDGQHTAPAMITTRFARGAALRLEPSRESHEVDRLPNGTRIMLKGLLNQPDGVWYLVEVVEPGQVGKVGYVKEEDGSERLVSQPGGYAISAERQARLPEPGGSLPQAVAEEPATPTPTPTPPARPTAPPTNTPRPPFTAEATATPPPTNTPRPPATTEATITPIPTNTPRPSPTPMEVAIVPEDQPDAEDIFEQTVQPRLSSEAAREGTATLVLENGQVRLYETDAFRELYPEGAPNILLEDPNTIRYLKIIMLQKAIMKYAGQIPTLEEIEADPERFLSLVGDEEVALGEQASNLGLPPGRITIRAIYEQPWTIVRLGRNPLGTDNGAAGVQKVIDGQLVLFNFQNGLNSQRRIDLLAPDVTSAMYGELAGVMGGLFHDIGLDGNLFKDQALYLLQGHLAVETVSR